MRKPWMRFFPADYRRDTAHLTAAEHGAYMLLLMHAWEHDGALPKDEERLRIIGTLDKQQWKFSRDALLQFFHESPDGLSLRNKRLDAELAHANARIESAREAGQASAAARERQRGLNGRPTAVATAVQRETQRTVNEDVNAEPTPSEYRKNPPYSPPIEPSVAETGKARDQRLSPIPRIPYRPKAKNQPPNPSHAESEENGHAVFSGFLIRNVEKRIREAARIDDARWQGNYGPVKDWMLAGILPDTIIAAIKSRVASKGVSYEVPFSLVWFDSTVRAEHGKKAA